MPLSDGSIRIDTRLNSKGFSQGLKGMLGGLTKLGGALGAVFGVGAITGITAFVAQSVKASTEYENAMIGMKSVVEGTGGSYKKATDYLKAYVSDGLVPMANAATAYKNLAARGYSTDQIEKTMTALKDSAAFGRQGSLSMGQAIQSATEGLKNENSILVDNAGVTKNVSVMWQDYARSVGKSVSELTKADKILAETNGILFESRFQVGDAAKLTETYSGKVARLGASFGALRRSLGDVVIPILARIIPAITKAVNWLTTLFQKVAAFMSAIFGATITGALGDTTEETQAAASAQEDLANATSKTKKEAQGSLAAFDQINVLAQEDGEAGGGTGSIAGGGIELPGAEDETEETANQFQVFAEKVKKFLAPIGEAWAKVGAAFQRISKAIGDALQPLIGDGSGLAKFGTLLRDGIVVVIDLLAKALDWLAGVIERNPEVIQVMVIALTSFGIALLLVNAPIVGIIAAVLALIAAIGWLSQNWDEVKAKAVEVWTAIQDWAADKINAIKGFFVDLGEKAQALWQGMKDRAKERWDETKALIKEKIDDVKRFFTELGTKAQTTWNEIKEWATTAWNGIKGAWEGAKTWFEDNIINPIRTAFETAWSTIQTSVETAFEGVKNAVKTKLNDVIGFLNGLLSAITNGINSVITLINGISFKTPKWLQDLFGAPESVGFSLPPVTAPQIPLLATGAVIPPNAQFAAILGDQRAGRNLEAPEALIRQIVREESSQVGSQEITINFGGSLGTLVRELKPYIDKENRRTGKSLVQGVRA